VRFEPLPLRAHRRRSSRVLQKEGKKKMMTRMNKKPTKRKDKKTKKRMD